MFQLSFTYMDVPHLYLHPSFGEAVVDYIEWTLRWEVELDYQIHCITNTIHW